ncbi:MAG: PleD family two-component system response regulator, partial [Rickettsiales bacterium]
IDGFEVCKRIKSDPEIAHVPVVMVTALSSKSDRLRGLEAGADDFITKPFNDIVFFARTKSLIRVKMLIDELRLRERTAAELEGRAMQHMLPSQGIAGAKVLIVDEDAVVAGHMEEKLKELYTVEVATEYDKAIASATEGEFDAIIVNTEMTSMEGLRLASQIKAHKRTRHVPLIIMVAESRTQTMLKALELGINDYLLLPVEYNEMMARVRTQIRRKRYQDALRASYDKTRKTQYADELTGLYTRHFMNKHLEHMLVESQRRNKPMTMMLIDIDHFKSVNNTYGHEVGNQVLEGISGAILRSIRTADMAARFGGEEFAVLLPETDLLSASVVCERIRSLTEMTGFEVDHDIARINGTVSIGAAQLRKGEAPIDLIKRADEALFRAKQNGRNQVQLAGDH